MRTVMAYLHEEHLQTLIEQLERVCIHRQYTQIDLLLKYRYVQVLNGMHGKQRLNLFNV